MVYRTFYTFSPFLKPNHMHRKISYLSFLILCFCLASCKPTSKNAEGTQPENNINVLSQEELGDGWALLFDGKTTQGWRSFKRDSINDGWMVEDGCLVSLGKGGDIGGDIITVDQFEDFDLMLEWAISEGGNSGILYHVLEGPYPAVYATGPEYQILDDVGYPGKLEEWQKTGANYAMHIAEKKTLLPVGEFNTSRIKVKDGRVEHWLNGEKIIEYDLWTDDWKKTVQQSKWKDYPFYGLARKGHISLQDHGSEVKFRNIKVKDLSQKGQPLFNGINLDGWKIHGTELWYAKDGELICESGTDKKYGYLATDSSYKDFILRLEFKQESNGNSGVFFRSTLDGTKISGWQVEVAPKGKDSGGVYESSGRGWLNQIPEERENILKEGEWNELIIKVKGGRVMSWLNGELMTELEDDKIGEASGVVALQIHGGGDVKVKWRNIYLREI
jgi:3-keto-disaccharide hydrolase